MMTDNRKCFLALLENASVIISLVLSIIAFLFATFPQINFYNTDPIAKANAGHSKSQMFLADHYYEIGDIDESYYWYKIASTMNSKYQSAALNNLAYIELTYYKADETSINYMDKALKVLNAAIESNQITALKNKYILLLSNEQNFFNSIDYSEEILSTEKQLIANNIDLSDFNKYKQNWVLKDTVYNVDSVPRDTEAYKFVPISADYVYGDNNHFKWIYTYEIYEKSNEATPARYEYIDFD